MAASKSGFSKSIASSLSQSVAASKTSPHAGAPAYSVVAYFDPRRSCRMRSEAGNLSLRRLSCQDQPHQQPLRLGIQELEGSPVGFRD